MPASNTIVLRPRFKIEIPCDKKVVLELFQESKKNQSDFILSCIDEHIFIRLPKTKQQFWSPQLHLEINNTDENTCILHGLFGPNPTVWTFFMFLHFCVAGLFIAFGVWAYTNWSLKSEFTIQLSLMLFMVIIWFVLYFAGSIGKTTSKEEMVALHDFMNRILEKRKS